MIDTHYHLDQLDDETVSAIIKESQLGGIQSIVAPSTGIESVKRLFTIQDRYPGYVHVGIGIHPEREDLKYIDIDKELYEMKQIFNKERRRICAIGEIGLPYYSMSLEQRSNGTFPEYASFILKECFKLARDNDLPVILHAVHSMTKPCLELLLELNIKHAVFHWLKAQDDVVEQIVKSGYFISVTPEVTYRKRDQDLTKQIPVNQLLLETDGPWKLGGPYQDKTPKPLWIRDSIKTLSQIYSITEEQVEMMTTKNAYTFFKLSKLIC